MFRYDVLSLGIDSELELPCLSEGHGNPHLTIRLGKVDSWEIPPTSDDEVIIRDIARVRVKAGREIVVEPLPGADAVSLRALVLGKVLAYLMRQRGYVPLHASSVAIEGRAVVFLGGCGAGKSTTAAAFYMGGHGVLADDIGAVHTVNGQVMLQPVWRGLRLLDDARAALGAGTAPTGFQDDKHVFHFDCDRSDHELGRPVPVARLYFLIDGRAGDARIRAEVVSGFAAVALLNSNSWLGPWPARNDRSRRNLARSASIASAMRVHRLFRPRYLDWLPALVEFVENDVAECRAQPA